MGCTKAGLGLRDVWLLLPEHQLAFDPTHLSPERRRPG
jgi:hypothetical protein